MSELFFIVFYPGAVVKRDICKGDICRGDICEGDICEGDMIKETFEF